MLGFDGRWSFATALVLLVTITPGHHPVRAADLPMGDVDNIQATTCVNTVGPGIPPPETLTAGVPGFHASWYGQSGYPVLCPGAQGSAVVAYYNPGSLGWVRGRMGEAAYLGTWRGDPGQDQPSVLGGDGLRGSPRTGWPRYNRVAQQPDPYVGPGQVAWFQFTIRAPETPGIYRLYIRPLIEGATWLEDFGVYWQVTVLNLDGSPPAAYIPMPDRVVIESSGDVSAQDISDVRSGAALASVFVRETFGTDVRAAIIRVRAGGTAYDSYGHLLTACCQADARGGIAYFDVTDPNWSGTTWTPRASHLKNVAHEYTHVWQASSGNRGCLVGETGYLSPRWFLEGLAEYVGYSVVLREGLVSDPGIDRRRRGARANLIVLRSLEGSDLPSA